MADRNRHLAQGPANRRLLIPVGDKQTLKPYTEGDQPKGTTMVSPLAKPISGLKENDWIAALDGAVLAMTREE